MTRANIQRLSRLLETERLALLSGDFEKIGTLVAEKTHLADVLSLEQPEDLRGLTSSLNRNNKLLKAAQNGINRAVLTLEKQRESREALASYDPDGKAKTISQVTSKTDRRF